MKRKRIAALKMNAEPIAGPILKNYVVYVKFSYWRVLGRTKLTD